MICVQDGCSKPCWLGRKEPAKKPEKYQAASQTLCYFEVKGWSLFTHYRCKKLFGRSTFLRATAAIWLPFKAATQAAGLCGQPLGSLTRCWQLLHGCSPPCSHLPESLLWLTAAFWFQTCCWSWKQAPAESDLFNKTHSKRCSQHLTGHLTILLAHALSLFSCSYWILHTVLLIGRDRHITHVSHMGWKAALSAASSMLFSSSIFKHHFREQQSRLRASKTLPRSWTGFPLELLDRA